MFGPKTQAVVVLLAAIIIGAAGGATVQHLRAASNESSLEGSRRPGGRGGPGRGNPFERLNLTEAQRGQVRSIMEAYEPQTKAIMDEMIPRIRAVRDSARAEIDGILTEEQRDRLEEMDNFWDRRRGPGRAGRPRGLRGNPPPFPPDSNEPRQ